MTDAQGKPIWYELLANDADAAQRFYTDVVGWAARTADMPGIDYRLFAAPDGADIGGMMTRPDGMGSGPAWLTYFGVDDVDASVAAIIANGGAVHMPAMDIPGVGRMAMVADPHGAVFYVMKGDGGGSAAFQQGDTATPGHAVWNELNAPDQDAAMQFYAAVFGWRHEGAMPMGPLGDYKFVHSGSLSIGASMNTPPNGRAGWQPYFMVEDVDAALDRLKAAGGTLIQGPDQIPGGGYSVVAEDAERVRFGFVGNRRAGDI